MRKRSSKVGVVFYISVAIVALFVLWGVFFPYHLESFTNHAFNYITQSFGWVYLIVTFMFLAFSLYAAFGPYGRIKLGKPDDEPEYSFVSWLAMLFSAGMGIGLMFWGVAEPLMHYVDPPEGIKPETVTAAEASLRYSFFHWGLHPWAIYAVVGMSLAYFQYRKDEPGLISSTFRPLLGDRVRGPIGKTIDVLAAIATAAGVATSLGLGAMQINGGLSDMLNMPNNAWSQLTIIAVVTVLFMMSAISGLDKGIKILSNVNLGLATLLLAFVLFAGPTIFLLETFTTTFGNYIGKIIPMSFRLTPFGTGEWIGNWTLLYWAWWIAWAPFVGTFIARVSKARTIREFVLTVLVLPTLLGCLWFAAFGGSGLFFETEHGMQLTKVVDENVESALFMLLKQFPFSSVLTVLATLLIVTFFVTSADSATFVLGTLTSKGGSLNPKTYIKVIWGVLISGIAAVLLLSGGLKGLQTASFMAALPFAFIMLLMMIGLNRTLKGELIKERRREKLRLKKLEELVEKSLEDNN